MDLFGQNGIKKKEEPKVQADQKNQKKNIEIFYYFSGRIRTKKAFFGSYNNPDDDEFNQD
jgi:methionine salvage enolase-phosphatase E1